MCLVIAFLITVIADYLLLHYSAFSDPIDPLRILVYVLLSTAVLLLLVGLIFGIMLSKESEEFNDSEDIESAKQTVAG